MVRKKRDMCVDTYQSRNTSCTEDVVLYVALGWSIDIGLLNIQKKRKLIRNIFFFHYHVNQMQNIVTLPFQLSTFPKTQYSVNETN